MNPVIHECRERTHIKRYVHAGQFFSLKQRKLSWVYIFAFVFLSCMFCLVTRTVWSAIFKKLPRSGFKPAFLSHQDSRNV